MSTLKGIADEAHKKLDKFFDLVNGNNGPKASSRGGAKENAGFMKVQPMNA